MKNTKLSLNILLALATVTCIENLQSTVVAQIAPSYTSTFLDDTMKESRFHYDGDYHWAPPSGADNFSIDRYERPTNQTYKLYGGRYASEGEYYGNLDIEGAAFGYDTQYLYVRIDLVDDREYSKGGDSKTEGLAYEYRFRINTDSSGRYGYLFTTEQPTSEGTSFHSSKNFGYRDTNGDANRDGDGYESDLVADGRLKSGGKTVLWSRIDPSDSSCVEFALDYITIGLNPATINSVIFESNKGLKDRSNYPWNKEYSPSEAGSPNMGVNGKSEFGTDGMGNVYELDTVKGIPNPAPPKAVISPPTGKLNIAGATFLRGTSIDIGFEIERK